MQLRRKKLKEIKNLFYTRNILFLHMFCAVKALSSKSNILSDPFLCRLILHIYIAFIYERYSFKYKLTNMSFVFGRQQSDRSWRELCLSGSHNNDDDDDAAD